MLKKSTYSILLSLFISCFIFHIGVARAANHALLVGVSQYPNLPQPPLEGPLNDVNALKESLLQNWDISPENITSLKDEKATKANFLKAIEGLSKSTRPGDFIFIYFSGHGTSYYDSNLRVEGLDPHTGALLMYDFKKGPYQEVLERLVIGKRDLKPLLTSLDKDRLVLVVFDSCFSGLTVRGIRTRNNVRPRYRYASVNPDEILNDLSRPRKDSLEDYFKEAPPYPYKNIAYIAASAKCQSAEDITLGHIECGIKTWDGQPHGVLTDAILRGLDGPADSNNDRHISINELFKYVKSKAMEQFPQTPQLLKDPDNLAFLNRPVFKAQGAPSEPIPPELKVKLEGALNA